MFKKYQAVKKLKKIKSFVRRFAFIICLAFVVLIVYTLHATRYSLESVAYAGIVGTKHDLSSAGTGTIKATTVTEKCVFCHTPHSSTNVYPLWNHQLSAATYTVLPAPAATASRISAPGQPDGGSKLCLGCHDGTVAIGAVINTPGRGSTGSITMAGGITTMPIGATGYIGKDLSTKHLVSIEFDQGLVNAKLTKCTQGYASTGLQLPGANDPVKLRPTTHNNNLGTNTGMGIQCRTCHDPHDNTNKCFLVKGTCTACPCLPSDNYDALCNTCHYMPCP